MYLDPRFRQLGGLGVLRGVILGFSEEAKTRGFPSPSFGGFGFVVICCSSNLAPAQCHGNLTPPLSFAVRRIPVGCDVRFGSLAAVQANSSRMAAFGGKADVRDCFRSEQFLNVCFSRKRTFRLAKTNCFEGPLSAKSGPRECSVSPQGFEAASTRVRLRQRDKIPYPSRRHQRPRSRGFSGSTTVT